MEVRGTRMAPAGLPSSNGTLPPFIGPSLVGTSFASYKRAWWMRVAPCLVFLTAFCTAMAVLLVWSEAAALRMAPAGLPSSNGTLPPFIGPSLVGTSFASYKRAWWMRVAPCLVFLTAFCTAMAVLLVWSEAAALRNVMVFFFQIGVISSTAWLESNLSWRGILILTEPKSFFEAQRSTRNPRSKVLHACLSTDTDTKEIKYHQESEVQVTKLGDGPNSLVSSDDGFPTTRLKCFPLYSVLLAYNTTTLDYLNLDSPDAPDGQVLDTIPWDIIRISILSIRWNPNHSETETKSFIDKMTSRRYKLIHTTDTGKSIFLYNTLLKL
ncbi:uncharacterized protein LOC115239347 [Formica exsecta]|uniref:uncharacterized protein LOC115239347 n=1 Tax=Formica exsecta TaxID=72781 RepID=UPI00114128D8|nr:uncharacterized protein LOC115239347 [Formica exsecta]